MNESTTYKIVVDLDHEHEHAAERADFSVETEFTTSYAPRNGKVFVYPETGFIGDNFTAYIKDWDCVEDSCQYIMYWLDEDGAKVTDGLVGKDKII